MKIIYVLNYNKKFLLENNTLLVKKKLLTLNLNFRVFLTMVGHLNPIINNTNLNLIRDIFSQLDFYKLTAWLGSARLLSARLN